MPSSPTAAVGLLYGRKLSLHPTFPPLWPIFPGFSTLSSHTSTPTSLLSLDTDTDISASATYAVPISAHCASSELWITYHQASRARKQVTAQLIDVSDAAHVFDLEDVLDHIFQKGFADPKWRSVVWWEECTSASHTVQGLLAWKVQPVVGVSVQVHKQGPAGWAESQDAWHLSVAANVGAAGIGLGPLAPG